MRALLDDLAFALRTLRNNARFAAAVTLVLALGIGANSAIFSLVDAALFRALPVDKPEELVRVFGTDPQDGALTETSYPGYLDLRDGATTFSSLAAFGTDVAVHVASDARLPERINGTVVSGNFFSLLGARATHGRLISASDDSRSAQPVAVLSDELWRARFNSDPNAVGASIRLNGVPFTVVGVAERGFVGATFDATTDIWLPLSTINVADPELAQLKPLERRGLTWLSIVGRLAPGASIAAAQAQMNVVSARYAAQNPGDRARRGAKAMPASDAAINPSQRAEAQRLSWLLLGVVAMVLLIACADAAGLLLARAERRRRELAIRAALGASRGRIVRQSLAESLVMSLAAAVVGLGLAMWLTDFVSSAAPQGIALPLSASSGVLATRTLVFSAGVSILTAVLVGLVPAVAASRPDLVPMLKGDRARVSVSSHRSVPLRDVLVAGQMALAMMLLVGAGLLLRTLANESRINPGFRPEGAVIATIDLSRSGYDSERGRQFYTSVQQRLSQVPGFEAVALGRSVPVQTGGMATSAAPEGYVPRPNEAMEVEASMVSPGYFRALGTPLLRGREFTDADVRDGQRVVIVNQAFADRYWPGQDPIGKHVGDISMPPSVVVGVVGTAKYRSLREDPRPALAVPVQQMYSDAMTIIVRTSIEPSAAIRQIAETVATLDAGLPLIRARTLASKLSFALARERLLAILLVAFAALAAALSAAGLYAVVAYRMQSRTREWGIRIAIGARPQNVLWLAQRQSTVLALVGLAVGLAGAAAATRFIQSLLFGVKPVDVWTYAVAAVTLGVVVTLAAYLPARRATRIDPTIALRAD
jgi:predicted permease